jgi:hypothetical protein
MQLLHNSKGSRNITCQVLLVELSWSRGRVEHLVGKVALGENLLEALALEVVQIGDELVPAWMKKDARNHRANQHHNKEKTAQVARLENSGEPDPQSLSILDSPREEERLQTQNDL